MLKVTIWHLVIICLHSTIGSLLLLMSLWPLRVTIALVMVSLLMARRRLVPIMVVFHLEILTSVEWPILLMIVSLLTIVHVVSPLLISFPGRLVLHVGSGLAIVDVENLTMIFAR